VDRLLELVGDQRPHPTQILLSAALDQRAGCGQTGVARCDRIPNRIDPQRVEGAARQHRPRLIIPTGE